MTIPTRSHAKQITVNRCTCGADWPCAAPALRARVDELEAGLREIADDDELNRSAEYAWVPNKARALLGAPRRAPHISTPDLYGPPCGYRNRYGNRCRKSLGHAFGHTFR